MGVPAATDAVPPAARWRPHVDPAAGRVGAIGPDGRARWTVVAWRARDHAGAWWPLRAVFGPGAAAALEGPDGLRADLRFDLDADGALLTVAADPDRVAWLAVDLAAAPDEHFVGLGERFDTIDQRGRQVDLRVINGATRDVVYKPVPFFMSSAGYGARLVGDLRSVVRLATPDDPGVVSWRVQGARLHLRLYAGPDFKAILTRYTGEIGRPAVPPAWVFGPWKSRDWTAENQETVLDDLHRQRELGLPSTVKLIDATWERESHDFLFDEAKYPDVAGMVAEAHRLGYRIVLWVSPFMVRGREPGPAYREADARGYLIRRADGSTYVHRLGNSPTYVGSCIDFTNPAAVAWWQGHVRRLVRLGISGFKTDFGEQVPDDARFHDGRRGDAVRHVFPRLYNRATYDAMQAETDGVLLARSGWDGSQAISAIWAGDQTSDFAPETGLPSVVTAGQSAGLSGFPFWTSDIGGYFGTPTDEAFRRWAQFGAFSPIMQVHGLGVREPWLFRPETLADYRACARWHMDLLPLRLSYAHEAARTGWPIMRALAFEFPDDPDVWGDLQETQFCLGRELLVAPATFGGETYRHVYFPRGAAAWLDYRDGERFEPGTMGEVACPADRIPVFARAGAIVPLLLGEPDTVVATDAPGVRVAGDDLALRIYPGADGRFTLHDGTRFRWRDAERTLVVDDSPVPRRIEARVVTGPAAAPHAFDVPAHASTTQTWPAST